MGRFKSSLQAQKFLSVHYQPQPCSAQNAIGSAQYPIATPGLMRSACGAIMLLNSPQMASPAFVAAR